MHQATRAGHRKTRSIRRGTKNVLVTVLSSGLVRQKERSHRGWRGWWLAQAGNIGREQHTRRTTAATLYKYSLAALESEPSKHWGPGRQARQAGLCSHVSRPAFLLFGFQPSSPLIYGLENTLFDKRFPVSSPRWRIILFVTVPGRV